MDIAYISFVNNGQRIEITGNGSIRHDGREVADLKTCWFTPDTGTFTVLEDDVEIKYEVQWNRPLFGSSNFVKVLRNGQIVLELSE